MTMTIGELAADAIFETNNKEGILTAEPQYSRVFFCLVVADVAQTWSGVNEVIAF